MLLVNTALNVLPLRSIYLNITYVLEELHFVMQETNFMHFAGTQARSHGVADECSNGKHTFHGQTIELADIQSNKPIVLYVAGEKDNRCHGPPGILFCNINQL